MEHITPARLRKAKAFTAHGYELAECVKALEEANDSLPLAAKLLVRRFPLATIASHQKEQHASDRGISIAEDSLSAESAVVLGCSQLQLIEDTKPSTEQALHALEKAAALLAVAQKAKPSEGDTNNNFLALREATRSVQKLVTKFKDSPPISVFLASISFQTQLCAAHMGKPIDEESIAMGVSLLCRYTKQVAAPKQKEGFLESLVQPLVGSFSLLLELVHQLPIKEDRLLSVGYAVVEYLFGPLRTQELDSMALSMFSYIIHNCEESRASLGVEVLNNVASGAWTTKPNTSNRRSSVRLDDLFNTGGTIISMPTAVVLRFLHALPSPEHSIAQRGTVAERFHLGCQNYAMKLWQLCLNLIHQKKGSSIDTVKQAVDTLIDDLLQLLGDPNWPATELLLVALTSQLMKQIRSIAVPRDSAKVADSRFCVSTLCRVFLELVRFESKGRRQGEGEALVTSAEAGVVITCEGCKRKFSGEKLGIVNRNASSWHCSDCQSKITLAMYRNFIKERALLPAELTLDLETLEAQRLLHLCYFYRSGSLSDQVYPLLYACEHYSRSGSSVSSPSIAAAAAQRLLAPPTDTLTRSTYQQVLECGVLLNSIPKVGIAVLKLLSSPMKLWRGSAMRSLVEALRLNPTILPPAEISRILDLAINNDSANVREGAVKLLCIQLKEVPHPSLVGNPLLDRLLERTKDAAISVRKAAMEGFLELLQWFPTGSVSPSLHHHIRRIFKVCAEPEPPATLVKKALGLLDNRWLNALANAASSPPSSQETLYERILDEMIAFLPINNGDRTLRFVFESPQFIEKFPSACSPAFISRVTARVRRTGEPTENTLDSLTLCCHLIPVVPHSFSAHVEMFFFLFESLHNVSKDMRVPCSVLLCRACGLLLKWSDVPSTAATKAFVEELSRLYSTGHPKEMEAAAQAFSAAIEHATKDVGPAFRCLQNSFERIQEFLGAHTMGNEVNRASLDVALDALDSHALAQLQRSLLGCGVLWKCVQFQDADFQVDDYPEIEESKDDESVGGAVQDMKDELFDTLFHFARSKVESVQVMALRGLGHFLSREVSYLEDEMLDHVLHIALNDFRRPRVQLVALNVLGDLLSTLKPSHEEDKLNSPNAALIAGFIQKQSPFLEKIIARGSKSVAVNCMQMLGSLVSHGLLEPRAYAPMVFLALLQPAQELRQNACRVASKAIDKYKDHFTKAIAMALDAAVKHSTKGMRSLSEVWASELLTNQELGSVYVKLHAKERGMVVQGVLQKIEREYEEVFSSSVQPTGRSISTLCFTTLLSSAALLRILVALPFGKESEPLSLVHTISQNFGVRIETWLEALIQSSQPSDNADLLYGAALLVVALAANDAVRRCYGLTQSRILTFQPGRAMSFDKPVAAIPVEFPSPIPIAITDRIPSTGEVKDALIGLLQNASAYWLVDSDSEETDTGKKRRKHAGQKSTKRQRVALPSSAPLRRSNRSRRPTSYDGYLEANSDTESDE